MIDALLLPLEVFPGWPEPPELSIVHLLMLTVVGPFAVALLITAICWAPNLMRRTRQDAVADGLADADENGEASAITSGAAEPRRAVSAAPRD